MGDREFKKIMASKKLWSRAILPVDSNIEEVIHVLNNAALKIALVTDSDGVLVGTISDGDIRRGLLKGLDLASPIVSIIHQNAIVVSSDLGREAVIEMMITNKIQQIPVVDENMKVIGLHLWDEVNGATERSNSIVIMAGGKGSRLHPETENCPKPLLPIAGKPILEHIINRAKAEGFSHFILAIYHLGYMIEDYFGNGEKFGVKIDYLREKSPLGTAGALSLLDPWPNSAFIVTNGDVITDIRYGELLDFHLQHNACATMAIRMHEWQNPFGVVQTNGVEITSYVEKPVSRSHINAGVYVIEPRSLGHLNKAEQNDMPTLFDLIQGKGERVVAFPIHETWLDVGSPEDLKLARFANGK
jgi:dTDP-glucose pyrophosphorylase/predicted transcriptional regulator